MIIKQFEVSRSENQRRQAGINAESQMARYLNRAFEDDPYVFVLHNLRLIDPVRTEHNGSASASQIDHLVVHRWGAFIIETKSVSEAIVVRKDGSGGEQWMRRYQGAESGMMSPIEQARMQGETLRARMEQRRLELLGRRQIGTRTLSKVLSGSDERGFTHFPIQIIVAISDNGSLDCPDGWKAPSKPFRVFVSKADQVVGNIKAELKMHQTAGGAMSLGIGHNYGVWSMKLEELGNVAKALKEMHEPRPTSPTASSHTKSPTMPDAQRKTETAAPPPKPATTPRRKPQSSPPSGSPAPGHPACKHCAANRLTASSGKYGYYWKCADCGKNTSMPAVCSICAKVGERGKGVRIRKAGAEYFRRCEDCEIEERIWTQPPAATA